MTRAEKIIKVVESLNLKNFEVPIHAVEDEIKNKRFQEKLLKDQQDVIKTEE